MKKRHVYFRQILNGIGLNPKKEHLHEIQYADASIFVLQSMRQYDTKGEVDLTGQSGYFFKWYGRPTSSSVCDDYRELLNYQRFENATGTPDTKGKKHGLVRYSDRFMEVVTPPVHISRLKWTLALSAFIYLKHGSNYEDYKSKFSDSRENFDMEFFDKLDGQAKELMEFYGKNSSN